MSGGPDWPLGLARLAAELGRDLQRAARALGGPAALWGAGAEALGAVMRLDGALLARVLAVRAAFDRGTAEAALAAAGIGHVALPERGYPARLREVFDPPFGLFLAGAARPVLARVAEGPVVAVVGSRTPTAAGGRFARDLAHDLARRGAVVVSGLARGIDTAVHEGALEGGSPTVAVLGSAVDVVHPRRNRVLAGRIRTTGLVVSEYWPGTPPAPWRFPARNRIVAGMAQAVVVVEAGARSGALITADFALEQGRPVLAVPGPPRAELAAGCHALIRAGAALCEGADDVVDEIPDAGWREADGAGVAEPTGLAGRVCALLRREPLRADQLAAALAEDPGPVAAALALLEVDGFVLRGEGQRYWAAPGRGAA
ncbi:MAG: DNA-processing protein DprA [Thermoleophilia bacterium]|nr:DNA-processing protein DprA [Thermoleophilia bacterium]